MSKTYTRQSAARDKQLCELLEQGVGLLKAAEQVGYCFSSIYKRRREQPEFAQQLEAAREVGISAQIAQLEAEADRRAIEGTVDRVTEVAGEVYEFKKYSDPLLMFRLKKLDPSYRDNINLNHSGEVQGVMVVPGCNSIDEWEKASQETHEGLDSE